MAELKEDGVQLNDDAVNATEAWSSKKIVDTLCPPFSVSGNPVVCHPVEDYPLSAVVTLEPKQAGSGDPSPENVRPISGYDSVEVDVRGKNLFDVDSGFALNGSSSVYGFAFDGEFFKEGVTYSFSAQNSTEVVQIKVSYASYGEANLNVSIPVGGSQQVTFHRNPKASNPALYIFLQTGGTAYGNGVAVESIEDAKALNLQIEASSASTPYEPYQPGTTATLTLPETIYGGTVDAVTGVGEKTWGYIASYNGESLPGEWISDRDVYASGTTPTAGAQVAYQLATPEPFQATGNQALPAVAGLNTVYTDGNSLAVSGRSDPTAYIQQQISDAITAAVAITGGT